MQDEDTSISYKIVLLGDSGVGKTYLMRQFVTKVLPKTPHPTIGVEFATKIVTLDNGAKVKAQIWDTAGQERYKSIASAKALGALLVYDVTRRETFENAKRWADELRYQAGEQTKILLAGNKTDLVRQNPDARRVSTYEAQTWAQQQGMLFRETSAVEDSNVGESFMDLLKAVYAEFGDNQVNYGEKNVIPVAGHTKPEEGGSCAC